MAEKMWWRAPRSTSSETISVGLSRACAKNVAQPITPMCSSSPVSLGSAPASSSTLAISRMFAAAATCNAVASCRDSRACTNEGSSRRSSRTPSTSQRLTAANQRDVRSSRRRSISAFNARQLENPWSCATASSASASLAPGAALLSAGSRSLASLRRYSSEGRDGSVEFGIDPFLPQSPGVRVSRAGSQGV